MQKTFHYRNLPIRQKLQLIILTTLGIAGALSCTGVLLYDQVTFRADMENELGILAEMVSFNSTAAITFKDEKSAQELLAGLRAKRPVVAAYIYTSGGRPFAAYRRGSEPERPAPPMRQDGSWFEGDRLILFRAIVLNHQKIGSVYLESDLKDLGTRRVRKGSEEVRLTPKEFDLLHYLLANSNVVIPHAKLLQAVWGPDYGDQVEYLRVFANQLRKKIEPDPSKPRYLMTEPWVGYRFELPPKPIK